MMRVKNEAPWIAKALESLDRAGCVDTLVLDDNSEDGTDAIVVKYAKLISSPFLGHDQARDKNFLLGCLLEEFQPEPEDWIIHIDGDEEILADTDAIRECLELYPNAVALAFQMIYLWDNPNQIRVDGWLGRLWRGSMFRVGAALSGFKTTPYGPNLHCGNIPNSLHPGAERTRLQIAHYGYMHKADRLRKFQRNEDVDPTNRARYRSLVIGDLLPADTRTGNAGPLELKEWTPEVQTALRERPESAEVSHVAGSPTQNEEPLL
jgi:glycosyltransferase involved in cell wall biosynthesis